MSVTSLSCGKSSAAPLLRLVCVLLFPLIPASTALAQSQGVPIESPESVSQDDGILPRAEALRLAGALPLTAANIEKQFEHPPSRPLKLVRPNRKPLTARELNRRAHDAHLQLGWYYRCSHCRLWHLSTGCAYAITETIVATCHHCITPDSTMREGYLIAVRTDGTVIPVTAVVADNAGVDAALLEVRDARLQPLPLATESVPGDRVYCYSAPLGLRGYFSEGIVNRFFWSGMTGHFDTLDGLRSLRMNVSTDWAPGSSGAAILDQCGNAVGHVTSISPMCEYDSYAGLLPDEDDDALTNRLEHAGSTNDDPSADITLITLHEGVPARCVLALANPTRDDLAIRRVMDQRGPELDELLAARHWPEAVGLIATLERELPPSGQVIILDARFRLALGQGDTAAASRWAEATGRTLGADPSALNTMAWQLVTCATLTNRDYKAAERIARRAVLFAPPEDRTPAMDTLARILFLQGRRERAVRVLQEAISAAPEEMREPLNATLESYRKGQLPPLPSAAP